MKKNTDSKEIKCSLMHYYRNKRSMLACCEIYVLHGRIADFLADSKKNVFEVEIKTSRSDFIQEFKNKKDKHDSYNNKNFIKKHDWQKRPNYFYICVPGYLLEFVKEYIELNYPNYGVMLYDPEGWYADRIMVIKRAKKLHNKYESRIDDINKKLSHEILRLYLLKAQGKDKPDYSIGR